LDGYEHAEREVMTVFKDIITQNKPELSTKLRGLLSKFDKEGCPISSKGSSVKVVKSLMRIIKLESVV